MAPDPLLVVAEELYALAPGEFTGTRNQWAKQTKTEDAALAGRISQLRKPSAAAWVVNILMRHQGDQMSQLLDLGASLRQAQADLDADSLRELTRQRRQLTAAVTHQGRTLATELGQKVTDAVADQVQATLHAAMVDEQAATAVRSGLLVAALSSTGVGDADVGDAVAVPAAIGMTARARSKPVRAAAVRERPALRVVGGAAAGGPGTADGADEDAAAADREREEREEREAAERQARRQRARDALDAATETVEKTELRLRKARRRVDKVAARTLQAADELDQARRRVAELEHDLDGLDDEADSARERQERAEAKAARAQEAVTEARQALDELAAE